MTKGSQKWRWRNVYMVEIREMSNKHWTTTFAAAAAGRQRAKNVSFGECHMCVCVLDRFWEKFLKCSRCSFKNKFGDTIARFACIYVYRIAFWGGFGSLLLLFVQKGQKLAMKGETQIFLHTVTFRWFFSHIVVHVPVQLAHENWTRETVESVYDRIDYW